MKSMRVRITFKEEILGTMPNNEEVYSDFIASKAPDAKKREEEIENMGVDEFVEKGTTVFPKLEDGTPFLYDYQIRGFFKSAAQTMSYIGGKNKLTAYKKKIDLLVFVKERMVALQIPDGKETGICQRPLRASTAQGERTALASSESLPEGTTCEFTIEVLQDDLMDHVIRWLDYGAYNGIGQWRNSGKGRFSWEVIE